MTDSSNIQQLFDCRTCGGYHYIPSCPHTLSEENYREYHTKYLGSEPVARVHVEGNKENGLTPLNAGTSTPEMIHCWTCKVSFANERTYQAHLNSQCTLKEVFMTSSAVKVRHAEEEWRQTNTLNSAESSLKKQMMRDWELSGREQAEEAMRRAEEFQNLCPTEQRARTAARIQKAKDDHRRGLEHQQALETDESGQQVYQVIVNKPYYPTRELRGRPHHRGTNYLRDSSDSGVDIGEPHSTAPRTSRGSQTSRDKIAAGSQSPADEQLKHPATDWTGLESRHGQRFHNLRHKPSSGQLAINISKAPPGIIISPPNICDVIEKAAGHGAHCGSGWEDRVQDDIRPGSGHWYLFDGHIHNAWLPWRLEEHRQGRGTQISGDLEGDMPQSQDTRNEERQTYPCAMSNRLSTPE